MTNVASKIIITTDDPVRKNTQKRVVETIEGWRIGLQNQGQLNYDGFSWEEYHQTGFIVFEEWVWRNLHWGEERK